MSDAETRARHVLDALQEAIADRDPARLRMLFDDRLFGTVAANTNA